MVRLLVGVVVALIVVVAALWLFQRRLIYLPTQRVPPIDLALPGWEEVTFNTDDGLVLGAWFREPEEGRPVVVVFNGNAGNRADRAPLGRGLAAERLGVLLVDYRGYGANPGRPTEGGLASDARGALRWVQDHAPGHRFGVVDRAQRPPGDAGRRLRAARTLLGEALGERLGSGGWYVHEDMLLQSVPTYRWDIVDEDLFWEWVKAEVPADQMDDLFNADDVKVSGLRAMANDAVLNTFVLRKDWRETMRIDAKATPRWPKWADGLDHGARGERRRAGPDT